MCKFNILLNKNITENKNQKISLYTLRQVLCRRHWMRRPQWEQTFYSAWFQVAADFSTSKGHKHWPMQGDNLRISFGASQTKNIYISVLRAVQRQSMWSVLNHRSFWIFQIWFLLYNQTQPIFRCIIKSIYLEKTKCSIIIWNEEGQVLRYTLTLSIQMLWDGGILYVLYKTQKVHQVYPLQPINFPPRTSLICFLLFIEQSAIYVDVNILDRPIQHLQAIRVPHFSQTPSAYPILQNFLTMDSTINKS